MKKTTALVFAAALLFSMNVAAFAQPQPTTVNGWEKVLTQVEKGQGHPLQVMMMKQMIEAYKQTVPKLPAGLQSKLKAGATLSNAEANRVMAEFGPAVNKRMSTAMGISADELPPIPKITPGSKEEKSFTTFVVAMKSRIGGGGGDVPEAAGGGNTDEALGHWKDFIHYSRIARLDLAEAHGRKLVAMNLPHRDVLSVVELSPYAKTYEKDLIRVKQMDGDIAKVAADIEEMIEAAKISVIRNPLRIRTEIEKLGGQLRQNRLATRRLAQAGEYAAPELVRAILGRSEGDEDLRPYVIEAMVQIGRSLVSPLCEAMPALTPAAQQDIARILARIGYPSALPYLKALIEGGKLDGQTQGVLQSSFDQIAQRKQISGDHSAADLFYLLAEDYYAARASLILEPGANYNVLWAVNDRGDLNYMRIPTPIFHDVMAMRAARRALQLDPTQSQALSLWIAANFRRENNLPEGASDPSYGQDMRSPAFYAMLAGPAHIKPVLARAMKDRDAEVALDGVAALAGTAGSGSLVTEADAVLAAMNYPDRRVRFETAIMIAKSNPAEAFTGSGRVVPVLAEAVRQSDKNRALVVSESQSGLNDLAARVRNTGNFEILQATTFDELNEVLATEAAADLIVIHASQSFVNAFRVARQASYKMQATPMVAIAPAGELTALNAMFRGDTSTLVVSPTATDDQLAAAVKQALSIMAGDKIDAAASESFAVRALEVMEDLAINQNPVFDISLARVPLVEALSDSRKDVVDGAGAVLALIEQPEAQRAIAAAAMDKAKSSSLRVKLLGHLASSFRRFGMQLEQREVRHLQELVAESSGRLADAASQAFGAASLPTAMSTDLITQ